MCLLSTCEWNLRRFFNASGNLRFLESTDEMWEMFIDRQAAALHVAIERRDLAKVQALFNHGSVHVRMIDKSREGSTAEALHRAAFANNKDIVSCLLNEIPHSWPEQIKREWLDCRTQLGFTAHMIACACGFKEIAELLEQHGCSTHLANDYGKTGMQLLVSFMLCCDQATVRPFSRDDQLHLQTETLEEYMLMHKRALNKDAHEGLCLWSSKQIVCNFSNSDMKGLEASVQQLIERGFRLAVHFTDLASARLILNGIGIRASSAGQLGGGVSVCLRSLSAFGWGGPWEDFCLRVGKALWGRYQTLL